MAASHIYCHVYGPPKQQFFAISVSAMRCEYVRPSWPKLLDSYRFLPPSLHLALCEKIICGIACRMPVRLLCTFNTICIMASASHQNFWPPSALFDVISAFRVKHEKSLNYSDWVVTNATLSGCLSIDVSIYLTFAEQRGIKKFGFIAAVNREWKAKVMPKLLIKCSDSAA